MYSVVGLSSDVAYFEMAERQANALDLESAAQSALKISNDFLRAKCLQIVVHQALKIDPQKPGIAERATELAMREAVKVRSNPVMFAELKALAHANSVAWGLTDSVENHQRSAKPRHRVPVLLAIISAEKQEKNADQVRDRLKKALATCRLVEDSDDRRHALTATGEVIGRRKLHPIILDVELKDHFQRACGLFGMAKGRRLASGRDIILESGLEYIGCHAGDVWTFRENSTWQAFYASLNDGENGFVRSSRESQVGAAISIPTKGGFDMVAPGTLEGVKGLQSFFEGANFNEAQRLALKQILYSSPGTVERRGDLQFTKRLAAQPQNWLIISLTKK